MAYSPRTTTYREDHNLKQVPDPRGNGITLTPTGTAHTRPDGWHVEHYTGSDGAAYQRHCWRFESLNRPPAEAYQRHCERDHPCRRTIWCIVEPEPKPAPAALFNDLRSLTEKRQSLAASQLEARNAAQYAKRRQQATSPIFSRIDPNEPDYRLTARPLACKCLHCRDTGPAALNAHEARAVASAYGWTITDRYHECAPCSQDLAVLTQARQKFINARPHLQNRDHWTIALTGNRGMEPDGFDQLLTELIPDPAIDAAAVGRARVAVCVAKGWYDWARPEMAAAILDYWQARISLAEHGHTKRDAHNLALTRARHHWHKLRGNLINHWRSQPQYSPDAYYEKRRHWANFGESAA